ncbi:MAG: YlmC/YmxH family sporulation protein [Oscillospiraceae bacterium]
MTCRMTEFKYKDVVNLKDGMRLGFISDLEIDMETSKMVSIIIYGKSRFFGIFGKKEDIIINWNDIEVIGEDTVLVRYEYSKKSQDKIGGWWQGTMR